jgi:hypothetical protein
VAATLEPFNWTVPEINEMAVAVEKVLLAGTTPGAP